MFEGFKSLWISLSIQFSIQWKDQIRWYVIIRWYAFVYVIWQTCLSQFLKLLFYCVGSVSGTHCPLIQLFTLRHFLQKYQTMFGYLPILKFLSLPHCNVSGLRVYYILKVFAVHELNVLTINRQYQCVYYFSSWTQKYLMLSVRQASTDDRSKIVTKLSKMSTFCNLVTIFGITMRNAFK